MNMLHEIAEGTIFKAKVRSVGSSCAVTLSPDVLRYIGAKQGDYVAIKCEKSAKHGNFVGIGLLRVDAAIEIEDK